MKSNAVACIVITSAPEGHRYRGVSGVHMHVTATTGARFLSS